MKCFIKFLLFLFFIQYFFSCRSIHSNYDRFMNAQLWHENSQFDFQSFSSALENALSGQDTLLQSLIKDNRNIFYEKLKNGRCCLSKVDEIQPNIFYSGTCYQKKGQLKTYRRAVFCIYANNNVLWDAIFAFSKTESDTFKIAFIKRPKGFNECLPIRCK